MEVIEVNLIFRISASFSSRRRRRWGWWWWWVRIWTHSFIDHCLYIICFVKKKKKMASSNYVVVSQVIKSKMEILGAKWCVWAALDSVRPFGLRDGSGNGAVLGRVGSGIVNMSLAWANVNYHPKNMAKRRIFLESDGIIEP